MISAARSREPGRQHGASAAHRTRVPLIDPAAALFGLAAGLWHALLLTRATNDNFLHMTLAQQLRAGDWPVRDFFEHGWVLQYTLSAAAQALAGERLFAEAVIVGAAWAVSTYLVFRLVRGLTGSSVAAGLAAVLLIVAGARGYSYPKGIVYAGAAALWWGYVTRPAHARLVAFAAWAAVAFYWRPDHGVLVAIGLGLALVCAHGIRRETIVRGATGAAIMLALMAPFLVFVQATVGLPQYVQTGVVQAQVEHTTHGGHEWPILRLPGEQVLTVEPPDAYAPTLGIRWAAGSSEDARREVLERYGLTPMAGDDDRVERVRLSARSIPELRALLSEPIVEDTAGIDRSTATLPASSWPDSQRWRFQHAWLRLAWLPSLTDHERASEVTAALFYSLAALLVVAAPWMRRYLPGDVTAGQLAAFGAFALLVDFVMLRHPFSARAPDGVVLSAVVLGCWVASVWRAGTRAGVVRRGLAAAVSAGLVVVGVVSVAGAGQFGARASVLAGGWTSLQDARTAWREAYGEIMASPPLRHFLDRPTNLERRLAAYVRECVPAADRLLVLWFAPDIYYNSGRLMAQRHLVFAPGWAALEHEQRMTLQKVMRYAPPIVLARQPAFEEQARATYPSLVGYVEQEYAAAGTVEDAGERYVIFTRRDRPALRPFGAAGWPCYARETSEWSRVGAGR